jgi:hypothetical protein
MPITASICGRTEFVAYQCRNWRSVAGKFGGSVFNASSDLPLRNISIIGNVVDWESQGSGAPTSPTSMGIGYWDSTNRNRIENLVIKDNLITQAPMAGIYLGAGGRDFDIASNTIVNPASSTTKSVAHGFKSGIFIGNVTAIDGVVRLSNNFIAASFPSAARNLYRVHKEREHRCNGGPGVGRGC